jgi:hypothetical protein
MNCPGELPSRGVARIARFVAAGGLLYTTDAAAETLLPKAFPGLIETNGYAMGEYVSAVRTKRDDDDLMNGLNLRKGEPPRWFLEAGSRMIRVLDSTRVEVLATRLERDGAPVVVRFKWGEGEVVHVVGHFGREAVMGGPAIATMDGSELRLTEAQKRIFDTKPYAQAASADVEWNYAFQRMTANMIVRRMKRREPASE